jgi:CRISPR-associated endonuclease/helicase Cas3
VAWREEVEVVTGDLLARYKPEDLLEDFPLKPHELLRDRSDRVLKELEKVANRSPDLRCWLLDCDGNVRVVTIEQLVREGRQEPSRFELKDCTLILPPQAGGLRDGILDGDQVFDENGAGIYDISQEWLDANAQPMRKRIWDDEPPPEGMRLVRTIDTWTDEEENVAAENRLQSRRYWYWYVRPQSADDDSSSTARVQQDLQDHLRRVEWVATQLVKKVGLPDSVATAVIFAARNHDLGKNRAVWQRSIGNREYPQKVLAKSGAGDIPREITSYRHEFGSLIELKKLEEFQKLDSEVKDLALHLVAAHHGRARPHFPADEVFDPDSRNDEVEALAREIPRRFARLQRKYGRWGLAYLESLVRAADALASSVDSVIGSGLID